MQVLKNHIVDEYLPVIPNTNLHTFEGKSDLIPSTIDSVLSLASAGTSQKAHVVAQKTFDTCAGVVHIVDDILLPAAVLADSTKKYAFALRTGSFSDDAEYKVGHSLLLRHSSFCTSTRRYECMRASHLLLCATNEIKIHPTPRLLIC